MAIRHRAVLVVIRANFPWPVLDPVVAQQCSRQGTHLHQSISGSVPSTSGVGNPPFVASYMKMQLSTATTPARPPGMMVTEPGSVSSISATRITATEPGGSARNINRSNTPDIPATPWNLQSSQPTSLSYATVTKALHSSSSVRSHLHSRLHPPPHLHRSNRLRRYDTTKHRSYGDFHITPQLHRSLTTFLTGTTDTIGYHSHQGFRGDQIKHLYCWIQVFHAVPQGG